LFLQYLPLIKFLLADSRQLKEAKYFDWRPVLVMEEAGVHGLETGKLDHLRLFFSNVITF
jgi:hypothetical protein